MPAIKVSSCYHFSGPSYRNFCKRCFCYPLQIQTFENGFEKWTEKSNKMLSVKEICNGDCTIFHCHNDFSEGRETTALLPHGRQPLSICIEKMVNTIAAIVREDRHITVRPLAQALNISNSSAHTILYEKLKMWRIAACWVPNFLTWEQRDSHIEICYKWLKRFEDEADVMGSAVTDDESYWIHHFDPATKQESMRWKSLQSSVKKKVHQAKSMNKVCSFCSSMCEEQFISFLSLVIRQSMRYTTTKF